MRTLVFGSLNIDRTYSLSAFVQPGETVSALGMAEFCGGKGFNQAIALARAGREVSFAGAVGADGQMLLDALAANRVDSRFVSVKPCATGHAVIQVDGAGQNSIIILAGANGEITPEDADTVLSRFSAGDLLVTQNEISAMPHILKSAHARGMRVAFNPSPYQEKIASWPLDAVDYLLINETEGTAMTGCTAPEAILDALQARYPRMHVVLTLGKRGAIYQVAQGGRVRCGSCRVQAVDTTAAGDTFTGYFLADLLDGAAPETALCTASAAAGLSVMRKGAEPSIPARDEVTAYLLLAGLQPVWE